MVKTNNWFMKPYKPGWSGLAIILILSAYICAMWVRAGMDHDSYYMIAQGREILESGIPRYNNFTFMDDKIVVQQWLYCVGIALADQIPRNWGLLGFMLIQAMALLIIINRMLNNVIKDPFWSWLITAAILLNTNNSYVGSYVMTLRPENITLILMLIQIIGLEKYRDTKNKAWLALLPISLLAEANLHISMWPIHVCVYLAYLVPPVIPWLEQKLDLPDKLKIQISDHIKPDGLCPDPWLYGSAILSMLAIFINPYGIDGVMYLFRSMPVFYMIGVAEQEGIGLLTRNTAINVITGLLVIYLIKNKKINATEVFMILGLTALACTNYHNTMFMPIAITLLARVMLRWLASKKPAKASSIMPNGVKSVLYAGAAISIAATCLYTAPQIKIFTNRDGADPIVQYILENKKPGENICNNRDFGSVLEYHGITGILADSRPELLLPSISGCDENFAWLIPWLGNNIPSSQTNALYNNDVDEYLDKNNIVYVIDAMPMPVMSYLTGWLDKSDEWTRVDLKIPDEIKTGNKRVYCIWERTDK